MHFLPFQNKNRDENFTAGEDNNRLSALFTKTQPPSDKNVRAQFQTLRTYMENYRNKLGKKTEEIRAPTVPINLQNAANSKL